MTIIDFIPNGDDATTTTINGERFNIDALNTYHYALYSNNTISNYSNCYLAFDAFKPIMFDNGTWHYATTCYTPYYSISTRGALSIALGILFGLTLIVTMVNLNKHGAQHLRESRRFRPVGRRWQWYWMLFVAGCALVSLFTGVDVDRYYLQQMPIVLQSFFFTLMGPATLAMVWEGTRHWGSWQERQLVDEDPYGVPEAHAKTTFYLPLVFYLFAWLDFFMLIPRSWTPLQKQNTPEQTLLIARPAATSAREKAGAIIAVFAWGVIVFSLHHSLRIYKDGRITAAPKHLLAAIALLAVRLAYGIAAAWTWDVSIFNCDVSVGWPYGLGYGVVLLLLVVFNAWGLSARNEDRQLIAQRAARGRVNDAALGLVVKPHWWERSRTKRGGDVDERLRELTKEGAGVSVAAGAVEMQRLGQRVDVRQRSASRSAGEGFRNQNLREKKRGARGSSVRWQPDKTEGQQRTRSMLDV